MFKKPFSTLNIIFYIAIFVFLAKNSGYVIFIMLYCVIMFCLPKFIAKKIYRFTSNPKEVLNNLQSFVNHWYSTNVLKVNVLKANSKENETNDSFEKWNELNLFDPFAVQDPPDISLVNVTHQEVWGDYSNPNLNADSTDDLENSNV